MKRYVWIGAAVVGAIFIISRCSSSDPHAAACNDDTTKSILTENLITKKKDEALATLKQATDKDGNIDVPTLDRPQKTNSETAIKEIKNLHATLVNIRQLAYDDKSEIRNCITELQWSPLLKSSTQLAAFGLLQIGQPCSRATYRVSKLLDEPDQVYVQWACRTHVNEYAN